MKQYIIAIALMLSASSHLQAANRFLFVTDSIFTQAYGSVRPSKMAFNIVNTKINGIVNVLGSPGLTVAPQGGYAGAVDLLPAIELWKGRFGASGVFLHPTTNDHGLSVPLATYESNLRTLIAGIQGMGLGVICIKPLWKSTQNTPNAHGLVLNDYRQSMTDVCAEYGAATLTFNAVSTDFVDGIHLNEAGHSKFAEWFIDVGAFLGGWSRIAAAASTSTTKTVAKK